MKLLDEKCLDILDRLESSKGFVTTGDTYHSAKPTQYPAHMKRLTEMEEAGLIKSKRSEFYRDHKITAFGKQVLRDLKN